MKMLNIKGWAAIAGSALVLLFGDKIGAFGGEEAFLSGWNEMLAFLATAWAALSKTQRA